MESIDITPEDSVAPVFLIPLTDEEAQNLEQWNIDEATKEEEKLKEQALNDSLRDSALQKLKNIGLSIEEAKAVIGLS